MSHKFHLFPLLNVQRAFFNYLLGLKNNQCQLFLLDFCRLLYVDCQCYINFSLMKITFENFLFNVCSVGTVVCSHEVSGSRPRDTRA